MSQYSSYPQVGTIVDGDIILFHQLGSDSEVTINLSDFATALAILPLGNAGGDLTGTYPDPTLAIDRIKTTILVAKGDIVGASASATPIVTSVGTDGQFLSASSSSPTGLAWATVSTTIPDGSITAAKLSTDSVVTIKIQDSAVTNSKLATNSVTITKIADGNVTLAKLANLTGTSFIGSRTGAGAPQEVPLSDGSISWPSQGIALSSSSNIVQLIFGSTDNHCAKYEYDPSFSGQIRINYGSSACSNIIYGDGRVIHTSGTYEWYIGNGSSSATRVMSMGGITNFAIQLGGDGGDSTDIFVGSSSFPTTATRGFLYIDTCAGAPTGIPAASGVSSQSPIVFDRTNGKLWAYYGSAWHFATFT